MKYSTAEAASAKKEFTEGASYAGTDDFVM